MLKRLLIALFFVSSTYAQKAIEGAGIQLFNPSQTSTLLVQGMRSGRYGWTKGHREPSDKTWLETALREVYEESGFLLGKDYWLCSSIPKQWGKRIYWQGITFLENPVPKHNQSEHQAIQWVDLDKLYNLEITNDVQDWIVYSYKIECD